MVFLAISTGAPWLAGELGGYNSPLLEASVTGSDEDSMSPSSSSSEDTTTVGFWRFDDLGGLSTIYKVKK